MQKKGRSAKLLLIGQTIKITDSRNRQIIGISGKAIDETKNTITIQTQKGRKKIPKDAITIKIFDSTIDGKKLLGRIETRIKQ